MRNAIRAAFAMVLCTAGPVCAAESQVAMKWSDLGPVVTKAKVALVLPSGIRIQGKVREVGPNGMLVDISKTSDRKAIPKGDRLIPRSDVSVLRVTKHRKVARILCTAGAVGAGALVAASSNVEVHEGSMAVGAPVAAGVGTIGLGVAGYFIGKRLDRTVTVIRILPDDR